VVLGLISIERSRIKSIVIRDTNSSCQKGGLWKGSSDDSWVAALLAGLFQTTSNTIIASNKENSSDNKR
jgi:hypothetical protein